MIYKPAQILLILLLNFLKVPSSSAVQEITETIPTRKAINKNPHKKIIVGGYKCTIENYPFLVSLRMVDDDEHFCGGTLLSKFWVLTALHCLVGSCSEPMQVVAGSTFDQNTSSNLASETVQISNVSRCYLYPVRNTSLYDLSLLKLETPILKTRYVGYAKLPFGLQNGNRSLVDICSNATIMGWGHQVAHAPDGKSIVEPDREYDPHLQCAHLSVISNEECRDRNYEEISPAFFCAYKEDIDSCSGDSGSPLMCNGYQYGIVSNGYGCAYEKYAGVYTNILYFKEFILLTMALEVIDDKSSANTIRVSKLSVGLVILVLELYLLN